MSDDFCLMHGYDFMVSLAGEKIPHCELCDELANLRRDRDALAAILSELASDIKVSMTVSQLTRARAALASIKENANGG